MEHDCQNNYYGGRKDMEATSGLELDKYINQMVPIVAYLMAYDNSSMQATLERSFVALMEKDR